MLAYYMDHNIPAALTRGLRQRGVDVLTAFEDHRDREKDPPLFERAHALQRVFVTFDDDFLRIAADWQKTSRDFTGLMFAHRQHFNVGAGIRYLAIAAGASYPGEFRNRVDYVPTSP